MRQYTGFLLPSGAVWPQSVAGQAGGGSGGGGINFVRFNWVRIHNRGASDVIVDTAAIPQNLSNLYREIVYAGQRRVFNFGGDKDDWPQELHILNIGAVTTTIFVEIADSPIVDIGPSTDPLAAGGEAPLTRLTDSSGNVMGILFPAGGTFSLPVADQSAFFQDSVITLAASATFTGTMRDMQNHNWYGAKAGADVSGTLDIDESDAATVTPIYQVATQATAASVATHGAPGTFAGQEARIVPQKVVLRFLRTVYINGATIQASFRLTSSASPLS